MVKRKTIVVLLGIMLVLISLSAVSSAVTLSSQVSAYRLDAKGGVPGPPTDKPKPPNGEDPPAIEFELYIEIDYMVGHEPTSSILTYIHDYYYARGIEVTFYADGYSEDSEDFSDEIPLAEEGKWDANDGISNDEFSVIEAEYNDVIVYDDQAGDGVDSDGDGYDKEHFLKEKWVLFGTTVENEPNVIGYTLALIAQINPKKADILAGNYIFLADDWAIVNGVESLGVEAVVLMHEIGHSIGIGVVEWNVFSGWIEVYDRDTYSVMSNLNFENTGYTDQWYYSDKYWNTRNMEYYTV